MLHPGILPFFNPHPHRHYADVITVMSTYLDLVTFLPPPWLYRKGVGVSGAWGSISMLLAGNITTVMSWSITAAAVPGFNSLDTKWLPPVPTARSVRVYAITPPTISVRKHAIIPPAFVYCSLLKNHWFTRIARNNNWCRWNVHILQALVRNFLPLNNVATLASCTAEVLTPLCVFFF